jgi:hypothetical protein
MTLYRRTDRDVPAREPRKPALDHRKEGRVPGFTPIDYSRISVGLGCQSNVRQGPLVEDDKVIDPLKHHMS